MALRGPIDLHSSLLCSPLLQESQPAWAPLQAPGSPNFGSKDPRVLHGSSFLSSSSHFLFLFVSSSLLLFLSFSQPIPALPMIPQEQAEHTGQLPPSSRPPVGPSSWPLDSCPCCKGPQRPPSLTCHLYDLWHQLNSLEAKP